jgi:hypothetical protein
VSRSMTVRAGGTGEPSAVWVWTDDPSPHAGDVRTWFGMLVDAAGDHVGRAGVTVHWTLVAAGGNATLAAATSVTGADGVATVACTYSGAGGIDDIVTVTGALA